MRAAPAAAAVPAKVNKNCRRFCDANIRPRCGAAEWYAGALQFVNGRLVGSTFDIPLVKFGRLDAVEAPQINGHTLAFALFSDDLRKLPPPGDSFVGIRPA